MKMYGFIKKIKSLKHCPKCKDCKRKATAGQLMLEEPKSSFMMCSGCSQYFCARLATNEDGGHARRHADSACHPVALWIDQPDAAYCFECGRSLSLKVIALAAPSHEFSYVVRGTPNHENTFFVNSLVQCLLALGKLQMWMFGPDAPAGPLGVTLKDLFVETKARNGAGATLNPQNLLKVVDALSQQCETLAQQDSQGLLLHLRNGLNEEEMLKRLPDMRKDVPTFVDSIFQGQVTYKCCRHTSPKNEAFYELSLTLQPKEHPTKKGGHSRAVLTNNLRQLAEKYGCLPAVAPFKKLGEKASQQRSGRLNRAGQKSNLRQPGKALQLEKDQHKVDSLPSIKECLEYYFREEDVIRDCNSCTKDEEPSTSQSKDSGQMVASINESTSVDWDQTERDRHGKAEEKSNLFSAPENQNSSTLNQDTRMQIELENTAHQVGEVPNKQKGKHADKALVLSKLPPVLTLHVLRFEGRDKRPGHVKFEENLDVGEYLDPRSEDKDNARYRLVGVIEHNRSSIEEGHYVAYVRVSRFVSEQEPSSSSSSWFYACDDDVREVSLDEVLKCEAFLLFYERIERLRQ